MKKRKRYFAWRLASFRRTILPIPLRTFVGLLRISR